MVQKQVMGERQHYSPEFKAEAVRMVQETGLTPHAVAVRLGIPPGTLGRWLPKTGNPLTKALGSSGESTEAELRRLRQELAELRMEREILKKATAYFARESLPGTRS